MPALPTMRDAWRRVCEVVDRRATPRAVLIAGYLVFLLYAYPGYLTGESANQLVDSRVGSLSDWQSPAMSELWWVVECVIAGSFGMLALQSALVLAGAYQLIRRVVPARAAALAACCVLLWPPVLGPLAVIWRDGQMAGFLLAGAAAVTSARRPWKLVGLALLLLGCAMRESAAVAALPVIVLGFTWRDGQRSWSRVAIAAAVWAAVVLGAGWLNDALVSRVTERPQVALATADITAMLRFGPDLDDAELQRVLAGTPLTVQSGIQARARVRLREASDGTAEPEHLFESAETPAERAAMIAARRSLARAHPSAYLIARWHAFYRVLGLSRHLDAVYTKFLERPEHRAAVNQLATHAWAQQQLNKWARFVGRSRLSQPYIYFVLALVLLPLAVRGRQREAAMLLASGLAHEVSLFVLAHPAEYRLSHWMILCTWLVAVVMVARRIAPRS